MVGSQSLQGLLQLLHGDLLISAVGANLAHQENFIAPSLQTKSHPFFTSVVVVLPRVVEKSDSRVDRLLNQAHGQLARLHSPEMISAKTDDGDLFARFSERPARHLFRAAICHLPCHRSSPIVHLREVSGVVSGTNQGPSALASISVTSLCV